MKFYLYILFCLILFSCNRDRKKEALVAMINDEAVYAEELNILMQQELFDELNRIYEMKNETLRQLVNNKILLSEAKKADKSKDLYIKDYVASRTERIGMDSLCRYYNIPDEIQNFHSNQMYYISDSTFEGNMFKQETLKSYIVLDLIDSLRGVYHVESYLYPPKSPVFKLRDLQVYYRGDSLSKVSVAVISDFDCEKCIAAHSLYDSIYEEYKDRVKFGYINFSATPTLAQIACDAANEQDKFWLYHDSLYSYAGIIDSSVIYNIAKQLDLDLDQFRSDVELDARREKIEKNIHQLVLMGIYATPTVVVNGRLILNSNSKNEITHLIDEELKK